MIILITKTNRDHQIQLKDLSIVINKNEQQQQSPNRKTIHMIEHQEVCLIEYLY